MALVLNPATVPDNIIDTWQQTAPGKAGYDSSRKCYCYGYRPAYTPPLIGLGGTKWSNNTMAPWNICPDAKGACGCRTTPPPGSSSTPPGGTLAPTTPNETFASKWGVTVGWLAAGALVAGGGFYAYKKGAFKKGRR